MASFIASNGLLPSSIDNVKFTRKLPVFHQDSGISAPTRFPRVSCCSCHEKNEFNSPNLESSRRPRVEARATEPTQSPSTPAARSIICQKCEGNGAVACSQCKGTGINDQDFFNGRFKAGTVCWLCRGKREMLCGECNGAGFIGGFLNSFED